MKKHGPISESDAKCHCGHHIMMHFSTNNGCMIQGCPCDEGFQPKYMEISHRLKAAMCASEVGPVRTER